MKRYLLLILLILTSAVQACGKIRNPDSVKDDSLKNESPKNVYINPSGMTVQMRFLLPDGFERVETEKNSYADYLRNLPLKPDGESVKYFNGKIKKNDDIYDAVVDLEIGSKDLHQCADAIMRLRAEYLWGKKQYDKIHFNFTNGFRVDYTEWMSGKRIVVKGNSTSWKKSAEPSDSYGVFWQYLEIIFTYAGTLSLSKELEPVDIDDLRIGDIFIQGGSPGHAVIVVDAAVNKKTNEKIFLLAQSYMPAQELQILKNNNDDSFSPWYSVDFGNTLQTPEWKFRKSDLKRFEE